ncbi:MAG: carboxypeptidase regulatory-like domain-containing protein [Longimicrobiales bacterium]
MISSDHGLRINAAIALVAGAIALHASASGDDVAAATPAGGDARGMVTIAGSVRFEGAPPARQPIDMGADPYCANAHGTHPPTAKAIDIGPEGRLRSAVVYVKQGLPAEKPPAPTQPVVLDQRGCMYEPRVVALRAGQTLVVRNSDATLHNVHVSPQSNRGFNIGQPIRGLEAKRVFDKAEVGIKVACDIHGWMGGAIAVFDHPWFAVTGEDGSYSLEGLPAGDYVVEVWHETLGTQTQRVTVTEGGQATASFTFPAS